MIQTSDCNQPRHRIGLFILFHPSPPLSGLLYTYLMNKKLALLFKRERQNLRPWEPTPLEGLQRIAAQCRRDEIAEIHIRLRYLQAEREMTPEWDGDTQDDIWKACNQLRQILKLIPKS